MVRGLQPRGTRCCHAGVTLDSRVQATAITSVGTRLPQETRSREGGAVSQSDYKCGMTTGPGMGQEGWEVKEDGWGPKASTFLFELPGLTGEELDLDRER